MHPLEEEVRKTTRLRPGGKDRPQYLMALMKAVAELPSDAWEGLSPLAQRWYKRAAHNYNLHKLLPEFVDVIPPPPSPPKPRPPAVRLPRPPKPMPPPYVSPPEIVQDLRAMNGVGAKELVKRIMIRDPQIRFQDLCTIFDGQKIEVSKQTISTAWSDFRHSLRILDDAGHLSTDLSAAWRKKT